MIKNILVIFLMISSLVYSDNEPNGNCSSVEIISEMEITADTITHTENGTYEYDRDKYDYYKFTVKETGSLDILFTSNTYRNKFYVGTSCGGSDLYRGSSYSSSRDIKGLLISKNQTVYLKVYSRDYSKKTYKIEFTFKKGTPDVIEGKSRPFILRYTNNIKGNVRMIGNTVLDAGSNLRSNNSQIALKFIDVDNDSSTFNSSSATIEDVENGIDLKKSKILWAGIFWQGVMHNDPSDPGIDSHYKNILSTSSYSTAKAQINDILENDQLTLTLGTGESYSFSKDEITKYVGQSSGNYLLYRYSSFADVTDFLKNKPINNTYTLANLQTRSGKGASGRLRDGTGNYGAWALVIVYDNSESPIEKTRNISIFDGYKELYSNSIDIPLSGFKTPKTAPNGVDSNILLFAAEGDRGISGDYAKVINEDGYSYQLPNSPGTNNYFASYIEGVPVRDLKKVNNAGVDIHTTPIGTSAGNDKPIKTNQTKATIRIGSHGDRFMPSVVGFATELYVPKLCYDYDIKLGDNIKLPTKDRKIDISSFGKDLSIKALIRSELSDFDLTNVKYRIKFKTDSETNTLLYRQGTSYVSPPFVNTYVNVPELDGKNNVAIGNLDSSKTHGVIKALESTYVKQKYDFQASSFKGSFDIIVEGDLTFDDTLPPVHYELSTAEGANSIKRCPINGVYDPIWGQYNVERVDSDSSQSDDIRYPLYTQTVGKDFDISVRRYDFDDTSNKYDKPRKVTTNVELEIIDAGAFSNSSDLGYDSSCEEPDRVGGSVFAEFRNSEKAVLSFPEDIPDFNNDTAYKNLAFRVWFLGKYESDGKFTIVDNTCSFSGDCYKNLYIDNIKDSDTNGVCASSCETHYNPNNCYKCLKINFAKPLCSRDNFSIKPDSFRVNIGDNHEDPNEVVKEISSNELDKNTGTLAAEYKYKIDIKSKKFRSENDTKGYYNFNFKKTAKEDIDNTEENILLENNNKSDCTDLKSYTYDFDIIDSNVYDNSKFYHTNVGEYLFKVLDTSWTEVDQASYKYKTSFNNVKTNDCIVGDGETSDTRNVKSGCNISSVLPDDNHKEIELKFNPYSFSFAEASMNTIPNGANKVLMNDFEKGNINMATQLTGKIAAVGKNDTVLTNFTDKCYSEDISISIDRETLPVAEEDLESIKNGVAVKDVFFQQYLKMDYNDPDIQLGVDKNVTLLKNEFDTVEPGKANIDLYLTFKKPINRKVSPIRITIEDAKANSEDAKSFADYEEEYIPEGKYDYNTDIDYFFAKVTPFKRLYGPTKEDHMKTPLFVDIYCKDTPSITCADFGLDTVTKAVDEDKLSWYSAKMFNKDELGVFDVSVETVLGIDASPTVKSTQTNSSSNIDFDDPFASQQDIEVKLGGDERPSSVQVTITPDPWLLYDENNVNGYPTYRINFIGDSAWVGVGDTGEAINNKSNKRAIRRMHW